MVSPKLVRAKRENNAMLFLCQGWPSRVFRLGGSELWTLSINLVIVPSSIVIRPACVARRKRGWALLFATEDSTGAMMIAVSMYGVFE